jgi:hypothetical protein
MLSLKVVSSTNRHERESNSQLDSAVQWSYRVMTRMTYKMVVSSDMPVDAHDVGLF